MTRAGLLAFLRSQRYAVQATVSARATPQAAVVGVAVSDAFEIVFDTLESSRKAVNLAANPTLALVFGSVAADATRSVQLEGRADFPAGAERERLVDLYLAVFPDGRERQAWPGLTYVRVIPAWLRDSDYAGTPPRIEEWDAAGLAGLRSA